MNILNFTKEEQDDVMSIVAGVLHFGNIKFKEEKQATSDPVASITNPDGIGHAASLWGGMYFTFMAILPS